MAGSKTPRMTPPQQQQPQQELVLHVRNHYNELVDNYLCNQRLVAHGTDPFQGVNFGEMLQVLEVSTQRSSLLVSAQLLGIAVHMFARQVSSCYASVVNVVEELTRSRKAGGGRGRDPNVSVDEGYGSQEREEEEMEVVPGQSRQDSGRHSQVARRNRRSFVERVNAKLEQEFVTETSFDVERRGRRLFQQFRRLVKEPYRDHHVNLEEFYCGNQQGIGINQADGGESLGQSAREIVRKMRDLTNEVTIGYIPPFLLESREGEDENLEELQPMDEGGEELQGPVPLNCDRSRGTSPRNGVEVLSSAENGIEGEPPWENGNREVPGLATVGGGGIGGAPPTENQVDNAAHVDNGVNLLEPMDVDVVSNSENIDPVNSVPPPKKIKPKRNLPTLEKEASTDEWRQTCETIPGNVEHMIMPTLIKERKRRQVIAAEQGNGVEVEENANPPNKVPRLVEGVDAGLGVDVEVGGDAELGVDVAEVPQEEEEVQREREALQGQLENEQNPIPENNFFRPEVNEDGLVDNNLIPTPPQDLENLDISAAGDLDLESFFPPPLLSTQDADTLKFQTKTTRVDMKALKCKFRGIVEEALEEDPDSSINFVEILKKSEVDILVGPNETIPSPSHFEYSSVSTGDKPQVSVGVAFLAMLHNAANNGYFLVEDKQGGLNVTREKPKDPESES